MLKVVFLQRGRAGRVGQRCNCNKYIPACKIVRPKSCTLERVLKTSHIHNNGNRSASSKWSSESHRNQQTRDGILKVHRQPVIYKPKLYTFNPKLVYLQAMAVLMMGAACQAPGGGGQRVCRAQSLYIVSRCEVMQVVPGPEAISKVGGHHEVLAEAAPEAAASHKMVSPARDVWHLSRGDIRALVVSRIELRIQRCRVLRAHSYICYEGSWVSTQHELGHRSL